MRISQIKKNSFLILFFIYILFLEFIEKDIFYHIKLKKLQNSYLIVKNKNRFLYKPINIIIFIYNNLSIKSMGWKNQTHK